MSIPENLKHLREKNILFLTHDYFSFTKDQIEAVAGLFRSVHVLVRYKPIAEFSRIVPSPALRMHRKDLQFDLNHLPANVNVHALPLNYLPNDAGYRGLGGKHFRAALALIRRKNIPVDLIHAHYFWSAGYAGSKLSKELNVPLVITGHGYDVYELPFKNEWWTAAIKNVLASANAVITVSKSNARFIEQLGFAGKTSVIPNGLSKKLFFPLDMQEQRKKLGLPAEKRIVIAVGYLDILKGHKVLLDVMAELRKGNSEVYCVIAGTGMEMKRLKKQCAQLGLENDVMFAGAIPHHEIVHWINAADMMVLPSLRESFGVVQIEAFACGKPVVATRNGGSEEIIISDDYGILCEAGNADELSKSICRAFECSWNSGAIAAYADQYTWEKAAERIAAQYCMVLQNS